jgi:hypothetical protein
MKRARITFVLVVAVVVILFYTQIGKTTNAKVRIEKSDKYTQEEITDAIGAVKKEFWGFRGCTLTELWYSERESDKMIEDYLTYGKGAENGIKPENLIVLFSDFDVNSSGPAAGFEPNSTQTEWSWTLIRDSKTDSWRVDDAGY